FVKRTLHILAVSSSPTTSTSHLLTPHLHDALPISPGQARRSEPTAPAAPAAAAVAQLSPPSVDLLPGEQHDCWRRELSHSRSGRSEEHTPELQSPSHRGSRVEPAKKQQTRSKIAYR